MIAQKPHINAKLIRLGILFLMILTLVSMKSPAQNQSDQIVYLFPDSNPVPVETARELSRPAAVEMDMEANIYLTDVRKNRILKLDPRFNLLKTTAGWGTRNEFLDNPRDVALDAGLNVLAADYFNRRIVRFDRDLNFLSDLRLENLKPDFGYPLSLAMSGWGDVYVLEDENGRVLQIRLDTAAAAEFGGFRPGKYSLAGAAKIASGENGNIFVALPQSGEITLYDRYGNRLSSLKTPFPPETLTCSEGLVWFASKDKIGAFKDNRNVTLVFVEPLPEILKVIDLAAARGQLVILTADEPFLLSFKLSQSPARIEW